METAKTSGSDPVLASLPSLLPRLEALYTDVHAHPELSMQEKRTAALAADRLRAAGYDVTTQIGHTGVVGLLRNGDGPTVMLRADMDALPVEEATGLPYASKVTASDREGKAVPVMHACGPTVLRADLYAVAALAGAAVVVIGDGLQLPSAEVTLAGAALCFGLRMMAIRRGWHLPIARAPKPSAAATDLPDDRTDDARRR